MTWLGGGEAYEMAWRGQGWSQDFEREGAEISY